MLIVRIRETFRQRAMEWLTAAGLTAWGLIVLQPFPVFDRPWYQPLVAIMPEDAWGWAATLIGVMRLIVLFINGAWHRTPLFRQIGCGFGLLVWSCMFMGTLMQSWQPPGAAIFFMVFLMDAFSLSFAAADGRVPAHGLR